MIGTTDRKVEFPTEEQLRETMNLKVQPEKLMAITGIGLRWGGRKETVLALGTLSFLICNQIEMHT